MKLKIKNLKIATGATLVAILNEKDAKKFDLHVLDRIKIKKGKKTETVVVDIATSNEIVPPGTIGTFSEVLDSLKLKQNDNVTITLAKKPVALTYIKKKLDGGCLSKKEIDQIVWDIVHNRLSEVELTYFVAACYTRTMNMEETLMLTKAIASHGDVLKINKTPIIDKHCIGGVAGNRTTMIVVPIVAAAGLTIPKTSSRSITSPAGTADTMEVLANVHVPINRMKKIVEKLNGCIVWGGSMNLAPADDKIIRVERPLRIDAESQLLASIMAKKHSVSSTHILIDIPVGRSAKVESKKEALKLKSDFEKIGKKLKKVVKVLITDGTNPIGNGIGPALEARDVLWLLKKDPRAPVDLKRKSILMAGVILEMAGVAKKGNGKWVALGILESGKAYKKMREIIKAQGLKKIDPNGIGLGDFFHTIKSTVSGRIRRIDNVEISKIARIAGAPSDAGAGVYLHKKAKEKVKKGEKLYTIYSHSKHKLDYAKQILKDVKGYYIK